MISAGTTAAPLTAPADSGLFTQTLSSPYFYGTGGSSLYGGGSTYSGGVGGFGGSYAASYGATYVGSNSRYTGNGYSTPFDPYGPAPTGYGMGTGQPQFGAPAFGTPAIGTPAFGATPVTGNQVVYAHLGTPQPTTTAGGPVTTAATPTPATPAPDATKPATTKPATKPAEAKKPDPKPDPKPEPKTVSVKSGDSLSKIAAAHGTTWQKLYELNKGVIGGNPNLIRPGQDLKLP